MKKIFTFLCKNSLSRFISVLPVVVLLSITIPAWSSEKWPLEAWPEGMTTISADTAWPGSNPISVECKKWPDTEEAGLTLEMNSFITLRTVVLHPADGQKDACISAKVVYIDNEYKIAYRGDHYKITPLSGCQRYDSQVEIGGIKYMFHLKLHPYE